MEELHLSLNEYKTVDLNIKNLEGHSNSLKKLHFTGNPIELWREIAKLGYSFPSLESLVLAECPIRSLNMEDKPASAREDTENMNHIVERNNRNYDIEIRDSSQHNRKFKSPDEPFRMLRFLNVNGTLLSTWSDIERIARFPALISLRIQGCPLFEVLLIIN